MVYRLGEAERAFKQNRRKESRRKFILLAGRTLLIFTVLFLEQYGMDLTQERQLHWWKFRALFQGLGEHTTFCKIMAYRSMELSKDMGKEQEVSLSQDELYRLPSSKDGEKLCAIEHALLSGET